MTVDTLRVADDQSYPMTPGDTSTGVGSAPSHDAPLPGTTEPAVPEDSSSPQSDEPL